MANKKTEVDIILPNFNSSRFIDKTIQSVINQSFKNWKLIIVDDSSDEKTKKKLKKYNLLKKVKVIWLKKNRGAAFCRNLAIKNSKSELIAFLDSDDIWTRNKLKLQIGFMKKNNYEFSYTNYKTFGLKEREVKVPPIFSYRKFIHNTSIATSTMIVRRKISRGVKFTDTRVCEDYFYKCSILKKIKYAYCLNKFLTRYQIRNDSLQSNNFKNLYWIWFINKKYNQLNFLKNLISVMLISFNSFKRYGLK